jgi:hypothetical protein
MQRIGPGDHDAVRAVFRATIALGWPLPIDPDDWHHLRPYEHLCLAWYLERGAGAFSRERDDRAYALVCVDPSGFARWQAHATGRFVAAVAPRVALGVYPPFIERFYRMRLRDGWAAARHRHTRPKLPHAHMNAIGSAGTWPGRVLLDFVDETCRSAGFDAWYGEVNAPAGRRAAALERLGLRVVDRTPNRTFSWLSGAPVERLTVVRRVAARRIARSAA